MKCDNPCAGISILEEKQERHFDRVGFRQRRPISHGFLKYSITAAEEMRRNVLGEMCK